MFRRSSWLVLGGWTADVAPEPPAPRCNSSFSISTFVSASMMLRSTVTCSASVPLRRYSVRSQAEHAGLVRPATGSDVLQTHGP